MNIVLYGISEELAQRTAMHYGFALCRPFETGTEEENRFWLQPRLENEEELLAFIERKSSEDEVRTAAEVLSARLKNLRFGA